VTAERVLGVDLGSRRIGVAVTDATATLASPLTVIERSASREADHRAIAELCRAEGAQRIVVGLPLSLSGAVGPAAQAALEEVEAISAVVGVPVETYDERFTTVEANRSMVAANRSARARRRDIDKVAAAVMLQAWLERRASTSGRTVPR
jgi:putative Holliday junction resolvase